MTVDEYVSTKVTPEHQETVAMLRALVRECAPEAEELISYGMPVFRVNAKTLAWILPNPRHVTLGFREGRVFEDKFDLLRGTGKHAKNIKLKSADSVDPDVLRYYVRQAVELDARV